mmetsp:Transcript_20663/g.26662  ORF Transcript_20663/g.26662 Transcript_20663/m.26662 type:complete len:139 (+) Transcript_20663:189-605(+)
MFSAALSRSMLSKKLRVSGGSLRRMAQMPVPQSQNAKMFQGHPEYEGWETTIYFWSAISLFLIVVVEGYAPDTTLESWASNEARARLILKEEKGFTDFKFGQHYQGLLVEEQREAWDKQNLKFLPKDDDDDEEDDDEE